jgi:hypothetical protein
MRKRTRRLEKTEEIKKSASPRVEQKDLARPANISDQLLTLQQTVGNRAVERLMHNTNQPLPRESAAAPVAEKSVDLRDEGRTGPIVENAPQGRDGSGGGSGGGGVAEKAPKAKVKKAGVESFSVKWSENPATTPANPRLRLDYKAKFKKDAEHDPALAEFRQNVMTKYEITDGPGKGKKGDNSPMHDDNYSRADDNLGRPKSDVNFESNDNPGFVDIDKDDDVNYSFTAEQMIIDTSQGNKVLEKVGPKTGTMKGKHPRKFSIPSNC